MAWGCFHVQGGSKETVKSSFGFIVQGDLLGKEVYTMSCETRHFEVTPKVLCANRVTRLTIRPLGGRPLSPEAMLTLQFLPYDESREPVLDYETICVCPVDGCLTFDHAFPGEQEHIIRVFRPGAARTPEGAFLNLKVYSLYDDLYQRLPWRGDLHAHSTASDGAEVPEIVAANYRMAGFDFFALTDHYAFWPSVQCRAYYEGSGTDLNILTGEEVHSPGNPVHIVHAGGRESVNALFQQDPEGYDRAVKALIEKLDVPDGVDAFQYAACIWVFQKIREAGGLAIFAHPFWMCDVYNVPTRMTDALFASKAFDAFELLGGQELHSNNLQTAYYFEAREKGHRVSAVGSSDAHGTVGAEWFTWMSTIAFMPDNTVESVIEAVRAGCCVAVERYPGEEARVYGPFRLVKFARFLLTEYFPAHDELCVEEGRLMRSMVLGDGAAREALTALRGRTQALLSRCYGLPVT
jgi:predicted metal-dependent phosphoesterase TrpH